MELLREFLSLGRLPATAYQGSKTYAREPPCLDLLNSGAIFRSGSNSFGFGADNMHIPAKLKQSRWLRPVKRLKKRWFAPSPPLPPLLDPPRLAGVIHSLPAGPVMTPHERLDLLVSLSSEDISDQIGAPDVGLRVSQVFQHMSRDSSLPDDKHILPDAFAADRSWTHWHALIWYTWRFRPRSYLEISADLGRSTAMVSLNSHETMVMTAELGRDQPLGWPHFQPARVAGELSRCGSRQPLRLLRGDSRRSLPRYWKGVRVDVIQEFDVIFVDGSRGLHGIYQDLKNAFAHCALGGMIIFRGMDRKDVRWPGQYHPGLHGLWDRLRFRYPGFRYLTAPFGREVGLAFRMF
jgi:hypothetical protein